MQLLEHQGIEGIGSDLPFATSPVLSTGNQRVVMPATIVIVVCAFSVSRLVTDCADATDTALHESSEQKVSRW